MLSSVLRSERAVQVNVAIACPPKLCGGVRSFVAKEGRRRMRAFVSLRRMLSANEALARKLAELERRLEGHDQAIRSLFDALRQLTSAPPKPQKQIGFHVKEGRANYRVKRK